MPQPKLVLIHRLVKSERVSYNVFSQKQKLIILITSNSILHYSTSLKLETCST